MPIFIKKKHTGSLFKHVLDTHSHRIVILAQNLYVSMATQLYSRSTRNCSIHAIQRLNVSNKRSLNFVSATALDCGQTLSSIKAPPNNLQLHDTVG